MSVEKFLKESAVDIAVAGSYSLPNWYDSKGKPRSFTCWTSRVSPYRMMVKVPVIGKVGDRVTSHFSDLGKLEGLITETTSGGLLFELEMTDEMREKFASKLTFLEKKHKNPTFVDSRKDTRIVPPAVRSTLTFADGTTSGCIVIDMSISGAAVASEIQPPIGMPLAVGACVGRVVRLLPNGFAVKFIEQLNRTDLNRLVVRPTPLPSLSDTKVSDKNDNELALASSA
ncbi:MAG TPA: PilZ domain-containing protein [Bradyrhizobium sp.]|nr:PilZ domain-containing protein [Bradyrhizobium sp.]